jgi:hypothetical protein
MEFGHTVIIRYNLALLLYRALKREISFCPFGGLARMMAGGCARIGRRRSLWGGFSTGVLWGMTSSIY